MSQEKSRTQDFTNEIYPAQEEEKNHLDLM